MSGAGPRTVERLVREGAEFLAGRGVPSPRQEAQILLAHVLGMPRSRLLAGPESPAPGPAVERYADLLRRRGTRVPLQHLTGFQEFWSLEFEVNEAVLIPRPETEILVEETLRRVESGSPWIADIGTGSGNIAVVLARERRQARIFATETSPEALAVARRNASRHGVADRIDFLPGDLAAPLEESPGVGRLDALVSNPPYIAEAELADLEPEVRDHEPRIALTPGGDGLGLYPALLAAGARFLKPGGWLLLELPAGGAAPVGEKAAALPSLELVAVRPDYSGIPRVLMARRRTGP